jgi:hypothetical protein
MVPAGGRDGDEAGGGEVVIGLLWDATVPARGPQRVSSEIRTVIRVADESKSPFATSPFVSTASALAAALLCTGGMTEEQVGGR